MLYWFPDESVLYRGKFIVIVLALLLTYSASMRFILFICISLLVNMLHAAVIPVNNMGHVPLEVDTAEVQHMDRHYVHIETDDLKSKNHCPESSIPCCMVLALQPFLTWPLSAFSSQERHAPFSLHLAKRTLVVPFRPPKFYLS